MRIVRQERGWAMKRLGRALVLAMGASTLLAASPVDRNAQAAAHATHSGGFHQGHSMRAMLLMSASVVKLAAVQPEGAHAVA